MYFGCWSCIISRILSFLGKKLSKYIGRLLWLYNYMKITITYVLSWWYIFNIFKDSSYGVDSSVRFENVITLIHLFWIWNIDCNLVEYAFVQTTLQYVRSRYNIVLYSILSVGRDSYVVSRLTIIPVIFDTFIAMWLIWYFYDSSSLSYERSLFTRNFKYGNFVNGRGHFRMNHIGSLLYYLLL